ncbi:hypothetical protein JCM8097_003374 [Rhodosporidiobolus ruineniae]
MFSRTAFAARTLRATPSPLLARAPVRALSSTPLRLAGQPDHTSDAKNGSPVTSTSHPTVPHAPPKPTAFFARKNIGLEVTPLMAFILTIVTLGTSFLVKNALTDQGVQHRHGVERDEELEKAISQPGGKDSKK